MKVDKIPLGLLGDVRQRLGATDENDTSKDKVIEGKSPKELVGLWTGWHLGDEGWGHRIIGLYEHLKELDKED